MLHIRVCLLASLLALQFLLLPISQSPGFAQTDAGAEPSPVKPDWTGHQVEMQADFVVITWTTETAEAGWVEYGISPNEMTQIAEDDVSPGAPTASHRVTLRQLPPDTLIFYVIVSGGARATKEGEPFHVLSSASTPVQTADGQAAVFADAGFGLSFVLPAGWQARVLDYGTEEDRLIESYLAGDGWLVISRLRNDAALNPGAWFEQHRTDYAEDAAVAGETTVGGAPAVIVSQPASCKAPALLLALVQKDEYLYKFNYLDEGSDLVAPAFGEIAGSLRFEAEQPPLDWQPLAQEFSTLPAAKQAGCEEVDALAAAAVNGATRCPGAAMYIPSPGTLWLPWNCFNYARYCAPYASNAGETYNQKPHRGLDILGQPGVTPVYAPYAGKATKPGYSNLLIRFSNDYAGKSVYYGHMRSNGGATDYRTVGNNVNVTAGQQIGWSGAYGLLGSPPHLHVSFLNDGQIDSSWPTLDPTQLLSAKNLVWYSGWNYNTAAIACSAGSRADSFEPDNFAKNARTYTLGSGSQRHEFHAPGDEDWVKFQAVAGRGYRIETRNLASYRSDTYISLYSANNLNTPILSNDDGNGGLASRIDWVASTSGDYYVKVRHYSWRDGYRYGSDGMAIYSVPVYGSDTGYDFRITTNIVQDRPAYANTSDPANPPARANDNSNATRWASGCRWNNNDWWWADVGSASFNDVYINFETAYAKRYFVGWSDNGVNYTGYNFTGTSAGLKRHLIGVRQARYLGIHLVEQVLPYCNYSIWEVSAFRMPVTATAAAAGDEAMAPEATVMTPDGELVILVRPLADQSHAIYLPMIDAAEQSAR